jgi:solute carrier family 35, member F5
MLNAELFSHIRLIGIKESVDCPGATSSSKWTKMMSSSSWKWCLGLIYIVAVASIWIAASYIVQSVVDAGVSPFLITYICNSLFVIYIPIVEVARYFEDSIETFWAKFRCKDAESLQESTDLESVNLLQSGEHECNAATDQSQTRLPENTLVPDAAFPDRTELNVAESSNGLDAKGRWTRARVARVSMVVSPFWFLTQLTFNMSLRYTTVTVSVISTSTLTSICFCPVTV